MWKDTYKELAHVIIKASKHKSVLWTAGSRPRQPTAHVKSKGIC